MPLRGPGSLGRVLERIAGLEAELAEVEIRLGDPAVQSDPPRLAELGRRFKQLTEIVAAGRRLRAAADDRDEARRMLAEAEGPDRAELRQLLDDLEPPPEALGEGLVHAQQVAGEQVGLLAPGRPPYLDDDIAVVVRVSGHQQGPQFLSQFLGRLFEVVEQLAQLGPVGGLGLGQHPPGLVPVVGGGPQAAAGGHYVGELLEAAAQLGQALGVGLHGRVAKTDLNVGQLRFKPGDPLQHAPEATGALRGDRTARGRALRAGSRARRRDLQ